MPIELGQVQGEAASGIVVQWLKVLGDLVVAEEPVVEIELEKVVIEVPAPVAGRLVEIVHHANDNVPFGTVLGFIDDSVS